MHPSWFTWIRNLAALLLILFWLTILLFQRRYIIRRYEEETPLSRLRFFQNPLLLTFKPSLQRSLKRGIYTMHVFMARVLPSHEHMHRIDTPLEAPLEAWLEGQQQRILEEPQPRQGSLFLVATNDVPALEKQYRQPEENQ